MDFECRAVSIDGKEVHLTPTEYAVPKDLATNDGKVVTRTALLRAVWRPAYEEEMHYLRVFHDHRQHKIERGQG